MRGQLLEASTETFALLEAHDSGRPVAWTRGDIHEVAVRTAARADSPLGSRADPTCSLGMSALLCWMGEWEASGTVPRREQQGEAVSPIDRVWVPLVVCCYCWRVPVLDAATDTLPDVLRDMSPSEWSPRSFPGIFRSSCSAGRSRQHSRRAARSSSSQLRTPHSRR